MHGAPLFFLKEATIAINTLVSSVVLVLPYFYVQARNKYGSLRKASSTQKNIQTPAAAVDTAMFSKTREYHSETLCARGCLVGWLIGV